MTMVNSGLKGLKTLVTITSVCGDHIPDCGKLWPNGNAEVAQSLPFS